MPQPNNEEILQAIVDCQSILRSHLVAVIQANANPETIRCFVESLQILSNALSVMGESSNRDIAHEPFNSDDLIREIATRAMIPVGERLEAISNRIDRLTDSRNQDG